MEKSDINICVELMTGECFATKMGKRCSNYHPIEQLLDSARKEFAKKNTTKRITRLCRNYNSTKCLNDNCIFLHIKKEKLYKTSPDDIIKPKKKEYKVIFEIKEKLWVEYATEVIAFGYNKNSITEQIWDGDIGAYDGSEVDGSRHVYDSEFLDESSYIEEI